MATWAEAGLTTAADLLAGNDDVRPWAADMLRRGLACIPEKVRVQAPCQLTLALEGTATHAYAVSFIVTNIPANGRPGQHPGNAETILDVETWFRRRTDIEDRIREANLGAPCANCPQAIMQ